MKIHACSHAVMLAQAHTLARYQIHTRMITHVPMRTDTDIWMTSCDDVIVMGPKCIVLFFSLTIFLSFSSFYMNASFGCCSFNCYNFLYHAFIYVHIILFRLEIYLKWGFPRVNEQAVFHLCLVCSISVPLWRFVTISQYLLILYHLRDVSPILFF